MMVEAASLAVILTAVAISSILLLRFSLPLETIYILTGIALTPLLAGNETLVFAEVGAVFILFFTAMNLRIGSIRDHLDDTLVVVFLHASLIAVMSYLAIRYGFSLQEAFLIGLTGASGSSMLAIDIIGNQSDRHLLHGRLTEGITFLQDFLTVLLVAFLAYWPDQTTSMIAIGGVGLVLLLALIGRELVRGILEHLSLETDITLLLGMAVLWAAAAAFHTIPYGTVFAAVGAGIFLSGHGSNFTLLETIGPVKDFFAPLFLVALGTQVLLGSGGLVLALILFLTATVVRPALTAGTLILQGIDSHTSIRTALQLDQISEMVLLLVLILTAGTQIDGTVAHAIILAAAGSFITSSFTTRHADRIYAVLIDLLDHTHDTVIERDDHVILAGYGHIGKALASHMHAPVIIDNDPQAIKEAEENGHTTVRGDIHSSGTWARASARTASRIILTIPDDRAAQTLTSFDADLILLTETATLADTLNDRTGTVSYGIDTLATDRVLEELATALEAGTDTA